MGRNHLRTTTVVAFLGAFVIQSFLFTNCGKRPGVLTEKDLASSAATVEGFDSLSAKIFSPRCLACHAEFNSRDSLVNSYMVVGKSPEQSPLYLTVAAGRMPKNGTPLTLVEVRLIYDWISAGGPATAPTGDPMAPGAPGTGTGTTPPMAGTSAISPTFAWIQANVITPRCVACHSGAAAAGNYDMSSYANTIANSRVVAGNPAASPFYTRIANNSMPPGSPLSAEVKAAIEQWIRNGAMNDAPAGGVVVAPALPPLEPKFSSIMANIIQARCISCHAPGNTRGGVDLSTYARVLEEVTPGDAADSKFYEVVLDNEMPTVGSPLSMEQKETIRIWINNGAMNN